MRIGILPLQSLSLDAPSLRECEVPRIGVYGGFVIVKLISEFVDFQFVEFEIQIVIFLFSLMHRFHLSS